MGSAALRVNELLQSWRSHETRMAVSRNLPFLREVTVVVEEIESIRDEMSDGCVRQNPCHR
jgi:hypothetical protein